MENPPPYTPYEQKQEYVPPGVAPHGHPVTTSPPGFAPPGHPVTSSPPGFIPPPSAYFQNTLENGVVIQPPIVLTSLGPTPQMMTCPFCHHTAPTRIQTEASTKTHLFALLMCVFLCWPCCIIPYCTDSCKSKQHFCKNCGAFLGAYDD